ncbi:MAG TPA: hypothetical protein VJU86_01950 [Pyrinomonadaceae bacterium]|nr:hypothetical protein [Pyrinomonadaceae bacterium]
MNEIDVLRTIAQTLSNRKSAAALSNYKVLCSNIAFVNNSFRLSLNELKALQARLKEDLKRDEFLTVEAKDNARPEYYFREIVPTIISNDISIIEKFLLYARADDRTEVTFENVGASKKGFVDFNNLVTTARQFIDSLVTDAYQLVLLDAKETNFHVLTSLSSFFKYATDSLVHALFDPEVEDCLQEFEALPFNRRVRGVESDITKCAQPSFRNKVDLLLATLSLPTDAKERLNDLFQFSSESTHIGYISTFFTSSDISEVIFGDEDGRPYLPSTENFSELKYEILDTSLRLYKDIYLSAVAMAIGKLLIPQAHKPFETSLREMTRTLTLGLETRNNSYFFPIKSGLVGSDKTISLPCKCGTTRHWKPPHDNVELYCDGCGSKFSLLELSGEGSYIFTGEGPVRIIGAEGPLLSKQERDELHREFYDDGVDLKNWTPERLRALSREARLLLSTLSALRKPWSVSTLNSLFPDLSPEKISDALERLQNDKLVLSDSEGCWIAEAIRQRAKNLADDSE